jgi:hypothetical protein
LNDDVVATDDRELEDEDETQESGAEPRDPGEWTRSPPLPAPELLIADDDNETTKDVFEVLEVGLFFGRYYLISQVKIEDMVEDWLAKSPNVSPGHNVARQDNDFSQMAEVGDFCPFFKKMWWFEAVM